VFRANRTQPGDQSGPQLQSMGHRPADPTVGRYTALHTPGTTLRRSIRSVSPPLTVNKRPRRRWCQTNCSRTSCRYSAHALARVNDVYACSRHRLLPMFSQSPADRTAARSSAQAAVNHCNSEFAQLDEQMGNAFPWCSLKGRQQSPDAEEMRCGASMSICSSCNQCLLTAAMPEPHQIPLGLGSLSVTENVQAPGGSRHRCAAVAETKLKYL
jgi:hypothetical protein